MAEEVMTEAETGCGAFDKLMTTFEKLESFKRFIIAMCLMLIFGAAVLALAVLIVKAAWEGNMDAAVESAKWLIALLATIIGTVTGFYFGSHEQAVVKNA